MFRLISGSSSITRIFLIIYFKDRKSDRHRGALAEFAAQLHAPVMQFDTAFYQEQAKPGARASPDIASAMEGFEQVLLIFSGNADSPVANDAHCVGPIPLDREQDRRARLRVFHCVAQEICENVTEQS